MLEEGDSVYVDKHGEQEFVVVKVDGDQITAVPADTAVRTTDKAHWYDINGVLRWA